MKCPTDGETLVMADRAGVEIDYCPKCRGVWLDRGELDKIIERSAQQQPDPVRATSQAPSPQYRSDDDYNRQGKPYKKRESFLGELFDF